VADLVGVDAPDETTLVIRLAFPAIYLPSLLADAAFRPIPREFIDFTPAWPSIASSGPYLLTDYVLDESLTLVRNPFWPDDLAGDVETVTITYTDDPAGAFTSGAADFARLDGPVEGATTRRGDTTTVLGFSTERAFVSNQQVRQALAWSLSRADLAADAAVQTFTHPGMVAGPDSGAGMDFAPDAARAALTAAGYPNCAGVPEIIGIGVPPGQEPVAEAMIQQWADVLACAPQLFQVSTVRADTLQAIGRDLIDEEYNDRIHLWLATYTTPHLDAHGGAADAFHCAYGYFYSGIPCGAVDGLIDWAAGMPDLDRADVYTRIENRLFGPAGTYPAVPLWADTLYLGAADTLSGVGAYGPAWWGDWTAG
jgi:ABC-type transport system substrate-binding protein